MKVMLLRTALAPYLHGEAGNPRQECLSLAYLAASLRHRGHEVRLLDMDLEQVDESRVIAELAEGGFGLAGITMPFALSARSAAEFLTRWAPHRDQHVHLTVGGAWATARAETVLTLFPGVHSVVLYEGEETLVDLVERLEQGQDWRGTPGIAYQAEGTFCTSAPRPRLADLDDLPFPARDHLRALQSSDPLPWAVALSSRGCHRRCTFCRIGDYFGNWRGRSPGNVVDELELLSRDLGVTRVHFHDDNFIGPGERGRERAIAIAELIRRRGLHLQLFITCSPDGVNYEALSRLVDAGLHGVFIGIESGCQARLTAYRKGTLEQNVQALEVLDRLGLLSRSEIGFIMFDPDGTLDEIRQNLAFLREHVPVPIPWVLANSLDRIYGDGYLGDPAPRALPAPLGLLRELFATIAMLSLDSHAHLDPGCREHAEAWTSGLLDLASYAVESVSDLVDQSNLTDESSRVVAAEVKRRAEDFFGTPVGAEVP